MRRAAQGFAGLLILFLSSCAFHSFDVEERFVSGPWTADCDTMLDQEEALGAWSVRYVRHPYSSVRIHATDGVWVLDVREYASPGRDTAAERRRLRSVTLRCEPDGEVSLPGVACLAPERYSFGWASSAVRTGTRVFVDASHLATGGSRGTLEDPCELKLVIEYGDKSDSPTSQVLLRANLNTWVNYNHAE